MFLHSPTRRPSRPGPLALLGLRQALIAVAVIAIATLSITGVQAAPAAPNSTIEVVSYVDEDENGQYTGGETVLAGFKYTLYDANRNHLEIIQTNGSITNPAQFGPQPQGIYTVCQEKIDDWETVDPDTLDPVYEMPCKPVTISQQSITYRVYFGQAEWPIINVVKYNDADASGGTSAGETRLAGFTMTVYDAGGAQVGQGVSTDLSSNPLRFPLPPGSYTVCETEQAGWFNTDPGTTDPNYDDRPCKQVTMPATNPGGVYLVQIGNAEWPILDVVKYNDADGSGNASTGDTRLAGFSMTVYDGLGAQVGQGATTNSSLNPLHFPLPPGSYTVCETEQAGWINSDPGIADPNFSGQPCKAVTLPAGAGTIVSVNLGNCVGSDVAIAATTAKVGFDWPGGLSHDVFRAADEPYFTSGPVVGNNVPTGWIYVESLLGQPASNAYYVVGVGESCGRRLGQFDFALVPGN